MSWDADLVDDRGHTEGSWNYTHNTNPIIVAALGDHADDLGECWWGDRAWWTLLDGANGPDGAAFLDLIVRTLEADPDRFRQMNPPNGWGDYDGLLRVLREMRSAVPEWPCVWQVCG